MIRKGKNMKILTKKLWLAVALLGMGTIKAAQAPVQEPIPEIQWRQAGRAFLPGLYEKAGANSLVKQLPQYVAQDIVKFTKPKEEYGLIKNFTNKPIIYFEWIHQDHSGKTTYTTINDRNTLKAEHQTLFAAETEGDMRDYGRYYIILPRGWCMFGWLDKIEHRFFDLTLQFQDEPEMIIKNVSFYDRMNISIYKENERIRLEVTSQDQAPVSYYAEPIKS